MQEPNGGGSGCLDVLVGAFVLTIQTALAFVCLICVFGIVVQVVDPGGGASGAHARRQMTVARRTGLGLFYGAFGFTCAYTAIKFGDAYCTGRNRRKAGRKGDVPRAG